MNIGKNNKITASIALFAIFLSFMAQITPLWVKSIDGQPIIICSSLGEKTIFLDQNGEQTPTPVEINSHCQMCLTSTPDYIAPSTETFVTALYYVREHTKFSNGQTPLHGSLSANTNSPRAPPHQALS